MAEPVRVLFITQDDPLFARPFFQFFFAEYPREDIEVAGITVGAAFNKPRTALVRRPLGASGALELLRLLRRLAGAKLRVRSIAALARKESISLLKTPSVNDARLRGPGATAWRRCDRLGRRRRDLRGTAAPRDDGQPLASAQWRGGGDRDGPHMTANNVVGARLMTRVLCQLGRRPVENEPLGMGQVSYYSVPKRDDVRQALAAASAALGPWIDERPHGAPPRNLTLRTVGVRMGDAAESSTRRTEGENECARW
jgi:hypothetical protein